MTEDFQNSETSLDSFMALYPCKATRPEALAAMWGALTPDERRAAARGAQGYAAHCKKMQRRPMDPVKFILRVELVREFTPRGTEMAG